MEGLACLGPIHRQEPLADREIEIIQRWVASGAVEGDARDLPPKPRVAAGWQLGTPDLVVSPAEPYLLPATGTDVFRVFVIPIPVGARRYVKGVELRPGNPKVVHHANIRIDPPPASRRYDDQDPAPGYEGLIAHSAAYPDGHFLGWTPGQVAPLLPKGLAWRLERGAASRFRPSSRTRITGPAPSPASRRFPMARRNHSSRSKIGISDGSTSIDT